MIAKILVTLVILIHFYIAILQMFLWRTGLARRMFALSDELAGGTRALAVQLGLYNLLIVVGLLWGLSFGPVGELARLIFLGFITISGVVGGLTLNWRLFLLQGLPGLLAFAATWWRI